MIPSYKASAEANSKEKLIMILMPQLRSNRWLFDFSLAALFRKSQMLVGFGALFWGGYFTCSCEYFPAVVDNATNATVYR